jgi:hypothetical protein
MTDVAPHLTAGFLRTRRSAAIAGIIFGVVLLAAMIMALTAERSDRQRSETRGAGRLSEAKLFDHLETDSAGLLAWLLVESRPVPESSCIRFDVHLLGSGSATGSARRAAAFY